MKKFVVEKKSKLSKYALEILDDLSFTSLMKSLRKKDVKVNGVRVSKDLSLNVGDVVEIYYSPAERNRYAKVFEDENILVVNKQSGYTSESVYERVLSDYAGAKFIHRLDRNTSGLMVFALNSIAEKELLNGFKNRTFEKYYTAKVIGEMNPKEKVLTAYLLKDSDSATVRIFDKEQKGSVPIKTGYKVINEKDGVSTLRVTLYTGKTHQIRAHLAHIGHPIIGDGKYGDFSYNQAHGLKAQELSATHLVLHFSKVSPLSYLDGKEFKI